MSNNAFRPCYEVLAKIVHQFNAEPVSQLYFDQAIVNEARKALDLAVPSQRSMDVL